MPQNPFPRTVYILRCSDWTLYTGITNDLEKRLIAHNEWADGAKYTKARRPVELVRSVTVADRSAATKEEMRIKKMKRWVHKEALFTITVSLQPIATSLNFPTLQIIYRPLENTLVITSRSIDRKSHSIDWHWSQLSCSTWLLAPHADGAIEIKRWETHLLITAVMEKHPDEDKSYMPLAVDFRESYYAAWKIGWWRYRKREWRHLTSRSSRKACW